MKQKNILDGLTKLAENPADRIAQIAKEYEHFTRDIRDPVIEAIVALAIMVLIYSVFPQIQIWLIVSFVVIVAVIVWAFALLILFLKDINRLPTETDGTSTKTDSL
jgi:uncharacterized membrane protein